MTDTDTFRPMNLGLYVGQDRMKELIVTHMDACRETQEPFPHLLLLGPPGSGKTTIANIVADMLGLPFRTIAAPPKDRMAVALILTQLGDQGGVIFIDEIHEWSRGQQDGLLTLLEEGYIDLPWGRAEFPRVTVIAATTEREKVRKPLMQRFTLQPSFEPYTELQLARIACDMAASAGLELPWEACEAFGRAAGGVPRQVRMLIKHAKALAASRGDGTPSEVLAMAGVAADGLTEDHVDYLRRLDEMQGQAGLATLSTRMRLHQDSIRDLERLLLDRNMVALTKTGRMITSSGVRRLREAA